MKTTFDTNGAFRGRRLVLRETPVDPQQKDQLKTLPEADWNPKLNPSTLPYSDSVIADLLRLLKGKGKKDGIIQINEKIIQKYPKPVSPCTLIGMPYEAGFENTNVSSKCKKTTTQKTNTNLNKKKVNHFDR